MANLDAFKSRIGGGVRPNQFAVRVTAPRGLNLPGLNQAEYLGMATTMPGSQIGQAATFHRGRMIPLTGERSFNPWTVTFYADQKMAIRTAFERWSNFMNDMADNTGEMNPELYKSSGDVFLLERNSVTSDYINSGDFKNNLKAYKVQGIFPIDVSEIQLGWEMNDQVMTFSVTFAVEDVRPSDVAVNQSGQSDGV